MKEAGGKELEAMQQSFHLNIHRSFETRPTLEAVVEMIVSESIQAAGLQKMLDDSIRSFGLRNWPAEKSGGWKDIVAKMKQVF